MHHELEDQVALGERPQHLGTGDTHRAAHGADATESRRLHLLVEQPRGVGDRVGGDDAADDGVGGPGCLGELLEVLRLGPRVRCGRGRDVHELLDRPVRRLGEVRGLVEQATHPRDVAHVELPLTGKVGVPLDVGGIPEVDVGVDDAFDRWCHQTAPPGPIISCSASSTHAGTAGPPNDTEPAGCGWLRNPNQSEPTTNSAPERAPTSGSDTRWATISPTGAPDASTLSANASTRRSVAGCAARESWMADCARLRPPAVDPSITLTTRSGRFAAVEWSDAARTHAASVPIWSVTPSCSSSTCIHASFADEVAAPASVITTASNGPDSAATVASCSDAPAKVRAGSAIGTNAMPREASAPVNRAARSGMSLTTATVIAADAPPSGAPSAKAVPRRGLPPPLLA